MPVGQIGVGPAHGAAHPAPELVELGQAHFIRILDDEGVHIGDVDARLDDGGAHQHIHLAVGHGGHDLVDLVLRHLAVGHGHGGLLPQQLPDARGSALDGLHSIVEVVHLTAPLQLPAHGVAEHRPVVLHHIGLHRLAVGGGLLQGGHVPDARHGHVQGPGDRRGRQGEHIYLLEGLLQLLLVGHAEALLLVHHQQAQVLEFYVLVEQPVGADEQVHRPVGHPLQGLFHLGRGAEAGDRLNFHRIVGKPPLGGEIVLAGQYRGGHQNGRLLAVQHALHDGPEGHLRLAVAHVAAQQAVHGPGLLHVVLDLRNAAQLVVGLRVLELLLEFPHPGGVGGEGETGQPLPLGIELDEPLGQVGHRRLGPAAGPLPVGAPQLVELLVLLVLSAADVFAHQVQLSGGHVEHVGPGVGQLDVILLHAVHRHLHHAHKAADSVVLMDHQVPWGQVGVGVQLLTVGDLLFDPALLARGGGPALGEHGDVGGGILKTGRQAPYGEDHAAWAGQVVEGKVHGRADLALPQHGLQVKGPLFRGHQHHRRSAVLLIVGQVGDRGLQTGPVGGQLLSHDVIACFGPQRVLGGGEGVQIAQREVGQYRHQLVQGGGKDGVGPVHQTVFQQELDVLGQLPVPVVAPLRHPAALGEAHDGVWGQIVGGRGHLAIDAGQVAVCDRPGDRRARQAGQKLGGRQEDYLLELGGAPLGIHIEQAHGVHVLVPEFDAGRGAVGRGVHVQNPAAQGELAYALHLLAPLVPRRGQKFRQLGQVVLAVAFERAAAPVKELRGQGALEQRLNGGHHQGRGALGHGVKGRQTAVLPLAGGHRAWVEQKLPGAQGKRLLTGEGGQVLAQPLALALVGADQHHRPAGVSQQGGGKMGAVDRGQSGDCRRAPAAVDGRQQRAVLRQILQYAGQEFHGLPPEKFKNLEVKGADEAGATGIMRGRFGTAISG